MKSVLILLVLITILRQGTSCSCRLHTLKDKYCEKSELDLTVVQIKIVKELNVPLSKRCIPPWVKGLGGKIPASYPATETSTMTSTSTTTIRLCRPSRYVRVLAKVTGILRQGESESEDVEVGQEFYLKTKISSAECGRAYDLKKGRKFFMKWPLDIIIQNEDRPETRISSCQFFPGKSEKKRLKRMKCGKKKRKRKSKNKIKGE